MKKNIYAIWLIPLAILLLIYGLSSQDAPTSTVVSKQVTQVIHTIATKTHTLSTPIPKLTNSQVRDLAHIGLFFLLGLSCMLALLCCHCSAILSSLLTLLLGGISAFLDECIQLTSAGRAFEWVDMGKDMLGIVLSILIANSIFLLIRYIYRYHRYDPSMSTTEKLSKKKPE